MANRKRALHAVLFAFALDAGCQRPQLQVIIDSDAPVTGILAIAPQHSPDAAVNALRIDALKEDGTYADSCLLGVTDPSDWPRTLGIALDGRRLRLRLRLFRRDRARATDQLRTPRSCGRLLEDQSLIIADPPPEVTIDRLVDLTAPFAESGYLRVLLSLSCLGARADLGAGRTCIDTARPDAPAAEPQPADAPDWPPRVGTSPLSQETLCTAQQPRDEADVVLDAPCVRGGLSVLGDPDLQGREAEEFDAYPLRPVRVSPFYMDRIEFSVGRLLALRARHPELPLPIPKAASGDEKYCTYDPAAPPGSALYPVNCYNPEGAALACTLAGGRLPSEAQWEHAARGRGLGRRFPWGDEWPRCETASLGRTSDRIAGVCPGAGAEPAGVHPADRSRDGILDLAGSMSETTRDQMSAYRARCGLRGPGLTNPADVDPACNEIAEFPSWVQRGNSWGDGSMTGASARRQQVFRQDGGVGSGFRCVYAGR